MSMSDLRDYGYQSFTIGNQQVRAASSVSGLTADSYVQAQTTQVFKATHDGEGKRLPHMNRSFISFSYGGKPIEDFNFIKITENNQMQKNLYADFDDSTTNLEALDGQIYWGTHFKNNELEFTLFTDGIAERELNDFKYWYKPGVERELILAENPNRAIIARVAEPPQYHMLPFEQKITVTLAGAQYQTSTTLYKGRIDLKFVMDDPFWYSLVNVLDRETTKADGSPSYDTNQWVDANGDSKNVFQTPDAIKIIHEDGVPVGMMLQDVSTEVSEISTESAILMGATHIMAFDTSNNENGSRVGSAKVGSATMDPTAYACVAYRTLSSVASVDVSSGKNNARYFYYAGTAPCLPKIQFTIRPQLNTAGYIVAPMNGIKPYPGKYNTITVESETKKEFRFTTPAIWTGYNQGMRILQEIAGKTSGIAWEELKVLIREGVKHHAPREWAITCIDANRGTSNSTTATTMSAVIKQYVKFVTDERPMYHLTTGDYRFNVRTAPSLTDSSIIATLPNFTSLISYEYATDSQGRKWYYLPAYGGYIIETSVTMDSTDETERNSAATFNIDCKTGRTIGTFTYRQTLTTYITSEEDSGDMVISNYLKIEDRNYPNEQGYVSKWTEDHPEYSHRVYHDYDGTLSDFSIQYKYMYL